VLSVDKFPGLGAMLRSWPGLVFEHKQVGGKVGVTAVFAPNAVVGDGLHEGDSR